MNMIYLHSVMLELQAEHAATLPATTGHLAHALFLKLISQVDPALSARLHEEQGYRPFTVSPLHGGCVQGKSIRLRAGQLCGLRVTLLDGGQLWQRLSARMHERDALQLYLGPAPFRLERVLATPALDPSGWAGFTDWQTLAATPARRSITMHFASPTAFSLGKRRFALIPDPVLVWDSLLRVWNSYTPEALRIEKDVLRDFVRQHVVISDSHIHTTTLSFPTHPQKGFVGTCSYLVQQHQREEANQLATLAEFAR
jgi:CRISPR-associated endoribonuclease Cas6